jgi:hypothetical protein
MVDPPPQTRITCGLVRIEIYRAADDENAAVRLVISDPSGAVVSVKEQEIPWTKLQAESTEALEARLRARLAASEASEDRFPWDLVRPSHAFHPVEPPGESAPRLFYQAIKTAIWEQAIVDPWEERHERLEDWPKEPVTVYYLWHIEAMVGGNGLEVYLSQEPPESVVGSLEALERAGCGRLAALYRRALDLAARQGCEATLYLADAWLEDARRPAGTDSWRALDHWDDGGTWALIRDELRPAAQAYIDAHRGVLLSGG